MLAVTPLSSYAHMIMNTPFPYGNPNNSPLLENGSDFPCKAVPYTATKQNDWPVGSSQMLSFNGTAVHGGGSCQVSVTTDKAPTKDSKWKVIHSIEGGCPAAAEGNLAQDGPSADSIFNFTIPAELPNGEMSMAWTWFNKIGNREMYMNCAPVTISGGSDDTAGFDALPDMAVANIGIGSCKTPESSDYTFENPGKSVVKGGKGPFSPLCGGASAPGGTPNGNGNGAPAPQPPAAAQSTAAPVVSQVPVLTSTLRTLVTITSPAVGPTPSAGGVFAPSAKPAPAPQPSAAPAPAPGNSNPPSSGSSCSPDGALVCSPDGTQFAICNFGSAVFQPVAQGTKCSNGVIGRRDYSHRNMRTAI